mgnify:CR=1 FL=1|tara:strand:- start:277 stop:924 length:648 start_codon:yes stop_codon:yes gene_type:complete
MPILDVRFAETAQSKAMIDTGSPGYLTISPQDIEGAKRAGGIGGAISGYGSLGGSMGGQAQNGKQLQSELKTLSIGNLDLGQVVAVLRESSPSLIGTSILQHFIVTLDIRSKSAYFEKYREGPFDQSSFGFAFSPEGKGLKVSLVWDDSPAANVGLRAGQHLISINGVTTTSSCAGIQSALQAMSGKTIELKWEGGAATLSRSIPIFQRRNLGDK